MSKNQENSYDNQLLKDFSLSASPEYCFALSMFYDSQGKETDLVAIQVTKKEKISFPEIIHIETLKVMVFYEENGVKYYEDCEGIKESTEIFDDLEVKMNDFDEVIIKKLDDQIELEHYTGKLNFDLICKAYDLIIERKS